MGRRSGSVRNVQRNMLFNQTGKLTPRLAGLESINVTVGLYFPGTISYYIYTCTWFSWFSVNDHVADEINAIPLILN
jgi:hypothetical protein